MENEFKQIDPKLTKPHFRTAIYRGLLQYCEKNFPQLDLDEVAKESGLSLSYLQDDSKWVSITFARKFTQALIKRTGDRHLSYNAGLESISPEALGAPIYILVEKVMPLGLIMKRLPELTSRFSRVTHLELKEAKSTRVEYLFSLKCSDLTEEEAALLFEHQHEILTNTLGYYEAAIKMKGYSPPSIHIIPLENENTDKNIVSKSCRIQIDWKESKGNSLRRWPFLMGSSAFLFGAVLLALGVSTPWSLVASLALLSIGQFVLNSNRLSPMHAAYEDTLTALKGSEQRYAELYELNQKISGVLETYKKLVPKRLIERLNLNDYDELAIGQTSSGLATALFSDIRDFTKLSQQMEIENLVLLLNQYYEIVNSVIEANGGSIDVYAGDGYLAVFHSSPQDAVKAGIQLLEVVEAFHQSHQIQGFKFNIGVGVATGEMVTATLGGPSRMQITHLSPAVNLASRLQDFSKTTDSRLFIDELTFKSLRKDFGQKFKEMGELEIRGSDQAHLAWALNESQASPKLKREKLQLIKPFLKS